MPTPLNMLSSSAMLLGVALLVYGSREAHEEIASTAVLTPISPISPISANLANEAQRMDLPPTSPTSGPSSPQAGGASAAVESPERIVEAPREAPPRWQLDEAHAGHAASAASARRQNREG
jgi:hypothetical protein